MDTMTLEVCPLCRKKAAPQFMWGNEDGSRICLECYHKEKKLKAEPKKRIEVTELKSESKSADFMMSAIGVLLLAIALLLGGVVLFYKICPPQKLAKTDNAAQAEIEKAKAKAKLKERDAAKAANTASPNEKKDEPEAAKDPNAPDAAPSTAGKKPETLASTAANGKTERMAPTVQALITDLPKDQPKPGAQDGPPVPSAISNLVDKATSAAAALKPDDKNPAAAAGAQGVQAGANQLHPTAKTKEKALQTKDAAIAVATALIDKNDPDGTKSAEALAKLGSISSGFASVADKLVDTAPPKAGEKGYGGTSDIAGGGTHLEADVLETQGKAGYDPEEAVRRELEEGAKPSAMIAVHKDPAAAKAQPDPNAAPGVTQTGVVQNTTALPVASLPAAFTTAAQLQQGQYITTTGAITGAASPAPQQISVVVMSMRGDFLFDSGSTALRPAATAQLTEIARILSNHPELPVFIRGYTDSKGNPEINKAISRKRAQSVRDWLAAEITNKKQNFIVQGLGAMDPAMPNLKPDGSDNPAGREKNRRVTVTIPQHNEMQSTVPQLRATQPLPQAPVQIRPAQTPPVQVQATQTQAVQAPQVQAQPVQTPPVPVQSVQAQPAQPSQPPAQQVQAQPPQPAKTL